MRAKLLAKCRSAAFCVLTIVAIPAATQAQCLNAPQPELPRSTLVVETRTGAHAFSVELAATPDEKACGLMFRQRLGRDEGMLFDYGPSGPAFMWMENTLIPLDMLFIAPNGRIVHIEERTVPFSRESVGTQTRVAGVLEVLAGTVDRLDIRRGDRVRHELFGTAVTSRP